MYFVCNNERKGTIYHEFFKGRWDKKTFWSPESIFIHDDVLAANRDFIDSVKSAVPKYNSYGVTEISREQWIEIGQRITDESSKELYEEASEWLNTIWNEYDRFTILGI